MKVFGHPVHVMLVHFPVALWPAHWVFHLLASYLPVGVGVVAGFWLLAVGCGLGWLAAFAGAADLLALHAAGDRRRLNLGLIHGGINGATLVAFTGLFFYEYSAYPRITDSTVRLIGEAAVLAALFLGNYFGGAIVWREPASAAQGQNHRPSSPI